MKKTILTLLSVLFAGIVVYAIGTSSVDTVPEKQSGDYVTALEFNSVVDTAKGISNTQDITDLNKYNLGLNLINPVPEVDLTVNGTNGGVLRTAPSSSGPICSFANSGLIYFNDSNKHFWACNGSEWKQLDVNPC